MVRDRTSCVIRLRPRLAGQFYRLGMSWGARLTRRAPSGSLKPLDGSGTSGSPKAPPRSHTARTRRKAWYGTEHDNPIRTRLSATDPEVRRTRRQGIGRRATRAALEAETPGLNGAD